MVKSKSEKTNKRKTVKAPKKVAKKVTPKTAKKSAEKKITKKTSSKNIKTTSKTVKKKSATKTNKKKKVLSFPKSVLENFRKIINIQKAELIQDIESLSGRMDIASGDISNENSIYSLHMADQGTDAMEREKNYMFAQRNDDHIKRLDDALKRIDNGTYGICKICNKLIEKKRLEAVPTTQKHVECKNKVKHMISNGNMTYDE